MNKKICIFGGSGVLGSFLVESLSINNRIISFKREIRGNKKNNEIEIISDFKEYSKLKNLIEINFKSYKPDVVIFSQRYRNKNHELKQNDKLSESINVESNPLLALYELYSESKLNLPINIINISSESSEYYNNDISLEYHLSKNLQVYLTKIFGIKFANMGIRANTLVIGEYQKINKNQNSEIKEKIFDKISDLSVNKRVCNKSDILSFIGFLIESNEFFNCQVFNIDGGMNFESIQSFVRRNIHEFNC